MPNLQLVQVPDKSLRKKSRDITREELDTPSIQMLIENMMTTMEIEGGVGLAAPQIGRHLNLIIVDLYGKVTAYINPSITKKSKRMVKSEEACLSIPGVVGIVQRHKIISMEAIDRYGKKVTLEDVDGFPSIVFQHETDHLSGILFIDRAKKVFHAKGDVLV